MSRLKMILSLIHRTELLAFAGKVVLGDGPERVDCGFFCKSSGVDTVRYGFEPCGSLLPCLSEADSAYGADSPWGRVLVSRVASDKDEGLGASVSDTNSEALDRGVPYQHSLAFRCGFERIERSRRQWFFAFMRGSKLLSRVRWDNNRTTI